MQQQWTRSHGTPTRSHPSAHTAGSREPRVQPQAHHCTRDRRCGDGWGSVWNGTWTGHKICPPTKKSRSPREDAESDPGGPARRGTRQKSLATSRRTSKTQGRLACLASPSRIVSSRHMNGTDDPSDGAIGWSHLISRLGCCCPMRSRTRAAPFKHSKGGNTIQSSANVSSSEKRRRPRR